MFPTRHREHRFILSVVFYVVNENPQNCIRPKSFQKQKKTPEIRRFQVYFWSCWADLNRRPHPYQRENLTFSSRFSSIKPYSLHFNYYLPLFNRRFSTASTAGCGCLCGQKAFPPKTLGYRESLFLFTVYLCHLKLATPLSEQFLGNFLRFFCLKSSLQKQSDR